jgi:hypothetical protein
MNPFTDYEIEISKLFKPGDRYGGLKDATFYLPLSGAGDGTFLVSEGSIRARGRGPAALSLDGRSAQALEASLERKRTGRSR